MVLWQCHAVMYPVWQQSVMAAIRLALFLPAMKTPRASASAAVRLERYSGADHDKLDMSS